MKGHAIAYSDLEAIRLSFRLRREKRSDDGPDPRVKRPETGHEEPGDETETRRMEYTDLPTLEEVIAEESAPRRGKKKKPAPAPARDRGPEKAAEKVPKEKMTFADPWPGQRIVFDPEAIRAKGFVRSVQTTLSGVQGYSFYKADGTAQFLRKETLLAQKMARKA